MRARIRGIASQFCFLFGLLLSQVILRHTDKLSMTLQNPALSSVEGQEVATLTTKTLQGLRSDENFNLFWETVEKKRVNLDVEEPSLPRRRKVPRRYELGQGEPEYPPTAKDHYRQLYFEVLDLAVTSIASRFDQPGFKIYSNVEQLLFKACSGDNYMDELTSFCNFYEDFSKDDLEAELKVLKTLFIEKTETGEKPSISLLKNILQSLSSAQRTLISTVCQVFQLLMVMPATNSTSERSFSALKRIKTYLRSTMTQARLNHLMVLHYHQEFTDTLDLKLIGNDFILAKDTRQSVFAKF